ncbi:hypothetical protein TeGR_g5769 [Tetraparma gracilis]|uniref:Protein phosphatase 1 regulatory subunit 7 n=1 Tax=Tetraparma gracilis TaxID=2962635 RepID=A0ABQ6MUZ1_9STRA|nr:hypothetical protein TeGR_g5769 [Tetraparma gracilis]
MSEFTSASLDPSASTPYVLSTKPVPASQVGSTPLPLDWTKMGGVCEDEVDRAPQDVVDYELDPADDHLSIVGTAGKKVTRIAGLEKMRLRVLVLRSHLIQSMEGCKEQTGLETLELYDNAVGELRDLECFPKLTTLDISFNVIRSTAPIASLSLLTELYIANNKLATLEGLENLACLKTLDVGANRLRTMDGLGGCVSLEHLWMGKNKITAISGLSNLPKIRRLDVQSNRLTSVAALGPVAATLEELYLASNGIDDEGLSGPEDGIGAGSKLEFPNLTVLDLSKNKITLLSHFASLKSLDDLWFSENGVASFDEVSLLKDVGLETIYLEHNPRIAMMQKLQAQAIERAKQQGAEKSS